MQAAPHLDDFVEAPSTLRRGDLPRVPLADSDQTVRSHYAALEEVDRRAFRLRVILVRPLGEAPLDCAIPSRGVITTAAIVSVVVSRKESLLEKRDALGSPFVRDSEVMEDLALIDSLVAEVVDGETTTGVLEDAMRAELPSEVNRHHGGVPVVGHEHHILRHGLSLQRRQWDHLNTVECIEDKKRGESDKDLYIKNITDIFICRG